MNHESDTARPGVPVVSLEQLADALGAHGIACRTAGAAEGARVRGMSIDSRAIEPDNLFVCKGAAFRAAYLTSAVEGGASAFLCRTDASAGPDDLGAPAELTEAAPGVPFLVVADLRKAMAVVAPIIYGHPDRDLRIVGITGTKGKTTVAFMLRSILEAAGMEPSMVGSVEVDDGIERFESHNTTPEAPDLWRHLRNTVDAGRTVMIMEVSSQALKYGRVEGITLDVGCFLNIGVDHISPIEHPSFEDYLASKLKLFAQSRAAVVNLDTDHLEEVCAAARDAGRLITVSAHRADADLCATDVSTRGGHIVFDLIGRATLCHVTLGMAGLFNIGNALAAAALARELGIGCDAIGAGLAEMRVPGRMELVSSPDGRVIAIVDYAHNELSYRALFDSVAAEYPKRFLIAVFGAPGDKAPDRRRTLPEIASRYADVLIYTEEDPAHERVEDICAEMAANTPAGIAHEIIPDRERAIERAFTLACAQAAPALVLLLAKGDERRQHRGEEFVEITSDLELARRTLSERFCIS